MTVFEASVLRARTAFGVRNEVVGIMSAGTVLLLRKAASASGVQASQDFLSLAMRLLRSSFSEAKMPVAFEMLQQ